MSHEHLCKSCAFTHPIKVGESCGNGYLYLEPKTACVGYKLQESKPMFDGAAKCDSSTYDDVDLYVCDGDSSAITFAKHDCDKCGKKLYASDGFHIWPDPDDKDDDQIEFHLHAKCFKRLLKKLIEL